MEIISAGYEIINQNAGLNGMYESAELPGRICYHSMDKKTDTSAEPFCKRLMDADHGAPLEHGTVYLKMIWDTREDWDQKVAPIKYKQNKFSHVNFVADPDNENKLTGYVTTNLRVLFENGWMDDLQYWCEPTKYHEKRIMVRFAVDRFTGEEFLRHRVSSFNRESTRYVCYCKDKFGGGSIKFILPTWVADRLSDKEYADGYDKSLFTFDKRYEDMCGEIFYAYSNGEELDWNEFDYWFYGIKSTEWTYNNLVMKCGWQAQQARTVLPCAINSPLIMTSFVKDWRHFFRLRALGTTGAPHPQAKELAWPLMVDFLKQGLVTKEYLLEGLKGKVLEDAKAKLDTITL